MMKMMKKIASLLLALLITLTMGTTAFAATINVEGIAGKEYTAYKIFSVEWQDKNNNSTQDDSDGYGYFISSGSQWYSLVKEYADVSSNGMTLTESGTADVYTVTVAESFDAAAFAKHLQGTNNSNLSGKTVAATGKINEGETKTQLTVADSGYYLVTTTAGSLCILKTAASNVDVKEKNSEIPDVVKKVKEDDTNQFGDSNTAQIGQEIEFQATVTVKYNPKNYVLHDEMSEGLDFIEVTSVTVNESPVASSNYTVKTEDLHDNKCTFEIAFKDEYLQQLTNGTQIVVTYKAALNDEAVIGGTGNTNKVKLEYQDKNNFTQEDTTTTYTYEFDLVKTNDTGKLLSGAEFKLYDVATGGNPIKFVKKDSGSYRVALAEETANVVDTILIPEGGTVKISGLDSQKYYLEETKAPAGYNPLSTRKEVDLSTGNLNLTADALNDGKYDTGDGGVQVENKTGNKLPETGGTGTVLFVVVGAVVVVGAGVLLVTKKRMNMIQ